MKMAIPAISDEGLSSTTCDHFGSAPFFIIFDTDTRIITAVNNMSQEHTHGACNPVETLRSAGADSILCRGMGARAVALLQREGITVYHGDYPTVGGMVSAWEQGERTVFSPAHACSGHGCG